MSSRCPDATATFPEGSLARLDASGPEATLSPCDMFGRLCVLTGIALCFGLAAQLLVGGPY